MVFYEVPENFTLFTLLLASYFRVVPFKQVDASLNICRKTANRSIKEKLRTIFKKKNKKNNTGIIADILWIKYIDKTFN